jgi:hypothetical protein
MSLSDFEAYTIPGLLELKNIDEEIDNESMIDVTEDQNPSQFTNNDLKILIQAISE